MVSEGAIWKLEKDLCRCCHAEGTFDNLATPQTFMDQQEIYSDMLRDCLDIEITPVPGNLCSVTYTICPTCVLRLRDANTFKQQVLQCEEKFSEMLYKNSILVSAHVKSEPNIDLDDYKAVFSLDDSDDDTSIKPIYEFQMEEGDDSDEDQPEHRLTLRPRSEDLKDKLTDDGKSVKLKKATKQKAKSKASAKKTTTKKQDTVPSQKKKEGKRPMRRFYYTPDDYTVKDDEYICTRCKKPFKKLDPLKTHIRREHFKIPSFICPLCDQGFMSKTQYVHHKIDEHNIDDRQQCSACQAKFFRTRQFRLHMNVYHKLGEIHKCPSCDYETFSLPALYKHKFNHRTVKDYHCKFCKKAFMRKTTLNLHEKIHTGDRQKVCQVCAQAFVQKASLNYHMTKYHPNVQF